MWLRWCEFFLVFWFLPWTLFLFREEVAFYAVPIVIVISAFCARLLYSKGVLQKHWHRMKKIRRTELTPLILPFLLITFSLIVVTLAFIPDKFLHLPFEQPNKWLLLLLLYPIISVIPQEIIFRTFFFHRYKKIIQKKNHRAVLGSVSFGFAHLIYGNWIAVLLSFLGSLLFSFRFIQSKSTAVVVIEHSLLGLCIFTIGLGQYFVAQGIY